MKRTVIGIIAALFAAPAVADGIEEPVYTFFQMDQNELRVTDEHEAYAWEAQGWIGTDFNKLYLKAEGETEFGEGVEAAEVQVLYSRLVSDFFDVEVGLRHDFRPRPVRSHAVLGLHGLAPHFFEVDAALFLSDEADLTARFEAEYELLITQRLVLQPLLEVSFAAQDIEELGIGAGITGIETGLRLRYEFRREIAPYIGLAFERDLFGTAKRTRAGGGDPESLAFVAGIRWFF
jgi:copper resistance protein B